MAGDYINFMAIIGSLFVISGGIHIRVRSEAKPWVNTLFLARTLLGECDRNHWGLHAPDQAMDSHEQIPVHQPSSRVLHFHGQQYRWRADPARTSTLHGLPEGVPFWWTLQNCWQGWSVTAAACSWGKKPGVSSSIYNNSSFLVRTRSIGDRLAEDKGDTKKRTVMLSV